MMSVDPYIFQQASCRASLLVASCGFRSDDWEDLRQEIVLDVLRRSSKFDPARGDWHGFVRGVARNHAAVLFMRERRRTRREVLSEDLSRSESVPGDDSVDAAKMSQRQEIEAALLKRIDVERVLGRLAPHLQELAALLSDLPVMEVCAKTKKSRSRVYQMTRQLRDAFYQAGFQPQSPRKSAVGQ